MRLKVGLIAATAALIVSAAPLMAADHQVQMLTRAHDGAMLFPTGFLEDCIPGDTVTFVPTDRKPQRRNVQRSDSDGAAEFKSKASEQYQAKFDVPGAYVENHASCRGWAWSHSSRLATTRQTSMQSRLPRWRTWYESGLTQTSCKPAKNPLNGAGGSAIARHPARWREPMIKHLAAGCVVAMRSERC